MMFPVFSTIIPVYRMLSSAHMVNTESLALSLTSVILPQVAGNMSFAIVVLTGYVRSLPLNWRNRPIWKAVILPDLLQDRSASCKTVLCDSRRSFLFLWSYNDLFTQMFLLRLPQHRAITRLLNELTSNEGTNFGLMAASVALVIIPILIVYIFLQKYIIKGMTAGAVKG